MRNGERKKIAGATRTLSKGRALCVIDGLSPFPYLLRLIARLYLIKCFTRDREPFPRFATRDKTLAPVRDNTPGRDKKNACFSLLCTSHHRKVTAAGIYYARTYAREKLEI